MILVLNTRKMHVLYAWYMRAMNNFMAIASYECIFEQKNYGGFPYALVVRLRHAIIMGKPNPVARETPEEEDIRTT